MISVHMLNFIVISTLFVLNHGNSLYQYYSRWLQALKMRQLKYLECYYAKDHFLRNLVFGTNQRRLNPVVELARSCLQVDINMRPTPAELLEKWDKLCEGGEVSATLF